MDSTRPPLWVPFLVLAYSCCFAHELPESRPVIGNLLSKFELKLQETAFEVLERRDQPRSRRNSRFELFDQDWNGYIPALHQHREELVLDSIDIVASLLVCQGDSTTEIQIDSVHYFNRHYVSVICGRSLSVYSSDGDLSSLSLLDTTHIDSDGLFVKHIKLYDSIKEETLLFVLVLTPDSLDVYSHNQKVELYHKQELLSEYMSIDVSYQGGSVYCTLVKKDQNGRSQPAIFQVFIKDTHLSFDLISFKSALEGGQVRMCTVGNLNYFFDAEEDSLEIHIFEYQNPRRRLERHQILDAPNITDFECFQVGATHYVALVSPWGLQVLEHIDGFFEMLQHHPRDGLNAISVLTPDTYRDEAILMLQGSDNGTQFVDLLIMDPMSLTFQSIGAEPCSRDVIDVGDLPLHFNSSAEGASCLALAGLLSLKSSAALVQEQRLSVMFPHEMGLQNRLLVVKFDVRLNSVTNPISQQTEQIQQRIEESRQSLKAIAERSERYKDFTDGIVLHGGDVQLRGHWQVKQVVADSVVVDSVDDLDVTFNPDVWTEGLDVVVKDLQHQMAQLVELVDSVEEALRDTIRNGTLDAVELEQLSISGSLLIEKLNVMNLSLEQLNGYDFDFTVNDIVRRDSDRIVESLKLITGKLNTSALNAARINAIPVEDLIVATEDVIHITGDLHMQSNVSSTGDVSISGSVNGIDLDRQLLTINDTLESLTFHDSVFVEELVVKGSLNGIVVDDLLLNVVLDDSVDVAFSHASFDHLTIDGDLHIADNKIGDVDVLEFNSSVIRLDRDETVAGLLNFSNGIEVEQNLRLGSMNDRPTSDLMLKRDLSDELAIGGKMFKGRVETRSIVVEGLVNDRRLDNVFTLDSDQQVTAPVEMLRGFQSTRNLDIETLNGVDYSSVLRRGIHPTLLEQRPQLRNVSMENDLYVNGTMDVTSRLINGEDFVQLLNDVVYSDEEDVMITGKKLIASLSVEDLQAEGYVNGLKLLDDLLTSSTHQDIAGNYELEQEVDVIDLNVAQLNQYNLTRMLDDVVLLDGEQLVLSQLDFYDDLLAEEIWINGSVNGVFTQDMAMAGVEQTFSALQILERPSFAHLKVGGHVIMASGGTTDNLINAMDIRDVDKRRVTKSTYQELTGNWKLPNVTFQSSQVGTLNDVTVDDWNEEFVRRSSSAVQIIGSLLNVDKVLIDGDVTSVDGINGFKLDVISQSAADIREDIVIAANVSFEHVEATSLTVKGTLNGYSLDSLAEDAVVSSDTPITGTKFFDIIDVTENVDVADINGGRLMEDYLHQSADQVIKTSVRFTAPVRTNDLNLLSHATLNGLKSESLFSSEAMPYNIHEGDVTFKHDVEVGDLETGSVLSEDWDQLLHSLAKLDESNRFSAPVTFINDLEMLGELTVERLNGVDVIEFAEDVVLHDSDAVITGRKSVDDAHFRQLSADHIQCQNVVPDIMFAADNIIRLDRDQLVKATIIFDEVVVDGDIQLGGRLNGHSFPDGYLLLDVDQELPFDYTIDHLVTRGDIELGKDALVDGYHLKAECNNTWMADSAARLQSKKTFQGTVQAMDINTDSLNGLDFNREVVTLDGGGVIYGSPHLKRLVVDGDVSRVGLTNDIDLSDLAADSLYLDERIHSKGRWKINSATVGGDNFLQTVTGNLNGLPIRGLVGSHSNTSIANDSKVDQEDYETVLQWYEAFRQSYFKIDHFDLNDTVVLPHEVVSLTELRLNSTSYLLIGTLKCASVIYRRRSSESYYSYAATVDGTGSVSKWLSLSQPGWIATLSTVTPSCNESGAKLWRLIDDDQLTVELVLIQDYGPDIVDITDGPISKSYLFRTVGNKLKELELNENELPSSVSLRSAGISSDSMSPPNLKTHNFLLESKMMIAQTLPLGPLDDLPKSGCPGVKIFSSTAGSMKLEHIVPACDVQHITTFTHGNLPDYYLVLAGRGDVAVYHYEGASGFVRRFSLPFQSAEYLKWFQLGNEGFIAVAKRDRVAIFKAIPTGDYIRG